MHQAAPVSEQLNTQLRQDQEESCLKQLMMWSVYGSAFCFVWFFTTKELS